MGDPGYTHTTPSIADGDGVRIIREHPSTPRFSRWLKMLALVLVGAAVGFVAYRSPSPATETRPSAGAATTAAPATAAPAGTVTAANADAAKVESAMIPQPAAPTAPANQSNPADWRTGDANDIATYVSPTDPEPTAAELIKALRDSGDYGGIAAFNPPGTSPPLRGLAVPEDFALPQGYVRHHQVTDAGEPLEAILMFSPDFVFRDAAGNAIAIPEDRVVPPEMAPPGLPIRQIDIPPPE